MGVETEAGYSWTNGTHARLLHAGNMFDVKSFTATDDVGSTADLVDNDLTIDRWTPFANLLLSPAEFDAAGDWTATNLTVASSGQDVTETADSGEHDLSQAFTFTAEEHVVAFKLERQTIPEVQVRANDGTTSFTCFFDLRDLSVGTASNCTGNMVELGDGQVLVCIYFTPVAATGVVELLMSNGSETVSYAGSTSNTLRVLRGYCHPSVASLRMDLFTAQGGTCFAIAAHNLFTGGGRITFEHDSNEDDTWTTIATVTPTDDGPIMLFFDSVSSSRWRITVDRGVLPEIGVARVGDPLVFERARYAGARPSRMNRQVDIIGNISRTGELLGRSVKRTTLRETLQWSRLSYSWVRANLDGPTGAIQSLETKAAFLAWRPETISDVAFIMRATTSAPSATGIIDLWDFTIDAEVYAYE